MNADRLHRRRPGLTGQHLPRSGGATAAVPLTDRRFHQPAAVATATLDADPPSMQDTSTTALRRPSSPAPSDRPEFRNSPAMISGTHTPGDGPLQKLSLAALGRVKSEECQLQMSGIYLARLQVRNGKPLSAD